MDKKGVFASLIEKGDPNASRSWFYRMGQNLTINQKDLIREATQIGTARSFVRPGRMYFFYYMPQHARQLPYYDRFPLVIPFNITEDGFTGLNMHYLPPVYRALLFDGLVPFIQSVGEQPDQTKIRMTYEMLTSISRLRYFKPAVKQYINTNVRSRFIIVPPEEWNLALMLPLESFAKKSINVVYRDSRQKIRNDHNKPANKNRTQ